MSADSFKAQGDLFSFGQWQIDLRTDEFADIRFRGHPVLRSMRAVVRDRDWNTADLVIDSREVIGASTDAGSVIFKVHSVGFDSTFAGSIEANFAGNRAEFKLKLTSQDSFQTNRTGLIVLHEPEVAGAALTVTHSTHEVEKTSFPVAISPNQPVFDIAGLRWNQGSGDTSAEVDMKFSGDIFEMEDQRNWTDASYKTYSRPLAKPFPYLVKKHETVAQTIEIQVDAAADFESASQNAVIDLFEVGPAPATQIGASTAPGQGAERPAYSEFAAAELVEIDLQSTNWRAALDRSLAGNLPLDVRVIYGDESSVLLFELIDLLDEKRVLRIANFDSKLHVSTERTNTALRAALDASGKNIATVSGARSHFTELNREQAQIMPGAQSVCFSSTPLFHSLTAAQLLEAVAIQRLTAEQAVKIAGGKAVHVGPITLRPRFNNVATGAQPTPSRDDLSAGFGAEFTGGDDDRQSAPELGAWAIASAAAFMVPGVESISWFEAWGPRGIRDQNGNEFEVSKALRAIAELAGKTVATGHDEAGELWAIATRESSGSQLLVANLSAQKREFEINNFGKRVSLALDPLIWVRLEI